MANRQTVIPSRKAVHSRVCRTLARNAVYGQAEVGGQLHEDCSTFFLTATTAEEKGSRHLVRAIEVGVGAGRGGMVRGSAT